MSGTPFRIGTALLVTICIVIGCDDNSTGNDPAELISGRWLYQASDLRGAQVTCSTSEVVLTLRAIGALRADAAFSGSSFPIRMECRLGNKSATLLFTDGATVENGEIQDGAVAFDFTTPDFLHTGTLSDGTMSGIVATRLDLGQTPLATEGIVNLVGTWEASRN